MPEDPDTNNVDGWDVTIGVPPDAQVLQIKNGQADFSFDQSCCIGAVANELDNDPATKDRFSAIPSLRISYATLNVNMPPFDNAKVRQAVNYAIDREAIVKILGGDLQASPIVRDPRRHDAAGGLRRRTVYPSTPDVEKAKALLAGGRREDARRRRDAVLPRGRRERRHRPADRVRPQEGRAST